MRTDNQRTATGDPWGPYIPGPDTPWDLRRVVHLHRRTAFGATWTEIQRDLQDGPRPSIDRLLAGQAASPGTPGGFEETSRLLADSAVNGHDPARLKAWWVFRMLFGPDPLGERLALLWHNHFATSNVKVNDLAAMRRQNELFRKHGRGRFGTLLTEVAHDPALLVWLDASANRKEHPNENLARELMELFTVGIGNYTEADVRESARALTGWTVRNGAFAEVAGRHDPGEKNILGRKGAWRGDDLLRILVEHQATSRRLATRICQQFMGEGAVGPAEIASLAEGLRRHQLDIGWAVGTVLRSQTFFADGNIGKRVREPVEFVVGAARALETFEPAPSTLVLADWAARLGQDLFYPPNVFGWPGGREWITTRSAIGRTNYAADLTGGFDGLGLARRHRGVVDLDETIHFFAELLLGAVPSAWGQRLKSVLGPRAEPGPETVRRVVALTLGSVEAQLG